MVACQPVQGFTYSALHAGLKKKKLDLALIAAQKPVAAAAVFTTSQVVAAPVIVARNHVAQGYAQALIINAGNANACTGEQGLQDAYSMCQATAQHVGCDPREVLCASTGVIGVKLPVEKITGSLAELTCGLEGSSEQFERVAHAIMTTDTKMKCSTATFEVGEKTYTMTGIAKGSGMIAPNMATMIGVILTDAPLSPEACDALLRKSVRHTFNAVTVDGDTSTNDTLVLMASGAAGGKEISTPTSAGFDAASRACFEVCEHLACAIASDGEGATKMVDVVVTGAHSSSDAEKVARTIAQSPLVKTALFGNDANWGRVAGAAGRSGVAFNQADLSVTFAGIAVCAQGCAVAFDEEKALIALKKPRVSIHVDLGQSADSNSDFESAFTAQPNEGSARIMTCDLTYDYVRINGEYRS